jgi:phenylpropionate dioxygenase-like ring-hydroxylating dioxygenase large terminal subunit
MLDDPVVVNDWHVVARASEIGPGGVKAARLLGREVVLWRNAAGIHAWLDLCRHRGARLSLGGVRGECLVCPYHGWCYDGSGACTLVPAHPKESLAIGARAEVFQARECYGLVWVCIGAPRQEVPDFPEWRDPAFRTVAAGPYLFRAVGTRVLENFLDVGHYPFVHEGFDGSAGDVRMRDYEVEWTEGGPVAREIRVPRVWKADTGASGPPVEVLYTYQVHRPLAASFRKVSGGECFAMLDAVTPVDECESLVWTLMALNYATADSDRSLVDYQDTVTGQDVPIVESQRPRLLPLDSGAEILVPSDKLAASYRKWLRGLGLKYGTTS